MAISNKKETASARMRAFPSTHRRLKVRAAKEGKTLPELLDEISKVKAG